VNLVSALFTSVWTGRIVAQPPPASHTQNPHQHDRIGTNICVCLMCLALVYAATTDYPIRRLII